MASCFFSSLGVGALQFSHNIDHLRSGAAFRSALDIDAGASKTGLDVDRLCVYCFHALFHNTCEWYIRLMMVWQIFAMIRRCG